MYQAPQVDTPEVLVKLKRFESQTISSREPVAAWRRLREAHPSWNRAAGYRNPPKPGVGSCSGAEHEVTAIRQPSCTDVRRVARLNFLLLPERFVAFSQDAGAIELHCRNQVRPLRKRESGHQVRLQEPCRRFLRLAGSLASSVLPFPSSTSASPRRVVLLRMLNRRAT